MKSAAIREYGGPEVVKIIEIDIPQPGPNDVLVRMISASVNPIDAGTRAGVVPIRNPIFPLTLGWDLVGDIVAVGQEVTDLRVGDRVVGLVQHPRTQRGTHSEYTVVPGSQVTRIQKDVDVIQAATLPLAGLTALQLIQSLDLQPGQTVLVNNPIGAVGGFATAIAKHAGAVVVGLVNHASNATKNLDVTLEHGSDLAQQLAARELEHVDAAVDVMGRKRATDAFDLVRDGGAYASCIPGFWKPSGYRVSERGISATSVEVNLNRGDLDQLFALMRAGVLSSSISAVLSLSDARRAHQSIEDARSAPEPGALGRLVLQM